MVLSPLVNPTLAVASALGQVLRAAAAETGGDDPAPRAGLPTVADDLRAMADLLDTMTPAEHR